MNGLTGVAALLCPPCPNDQTSAKWSLNSKPSGWGTMHAIACSTFHGSDFIPHSANDFWWVSSIMRKSSVDWGVQALWWDFWQYYCIRSKVACFWLFGWSAGFRCHWVPPLTIPGVSWKDSVEFSVKIETKIQRFIEATLGLILRENDVFQMPIEIFDAWVCIHSCRSSASYELKNEASRRIPSLTTSLGQGTENKNKGLKLARLLIISSAQVCVGWLVTFMLTPTSVF